MGDLGSIPWLGRSPGEGKGYPLQYSGLENSMDYPWTIFHDYILIYLILMVGEEVVRTFYSLNNFKVYDTILFIIVIIIYIRSAELIDFMARSLCTLIKFSPFFPLPETDNCSSTVSQNDFYF